MNKHTPGPWSVPAWPNMRPVVCAGMEVICKTLGCQPDSRANAHLIAAAPTMLEALLFIRNQSRDLEEAKGRAMMVLRQLEGK